MPERCIELRDAPPPEQAGIAKIRHFSEKRVLQCPDQVVISTPTPTALPTTATETKPKTTVNKGPGRMGA